VAGAGPPLAPLELLGQRLVLRCDVLRERVCLVCLAVGHLGDLVRLAARTGEERARCLEDTGGVPAVLLPNA